jgi:hypothetical protein
VISGEIKKAGEGNPKAKPIGKCGAEKAPLLGARASSKATENERTNGRSPSAPPLPNPKMAKPTATTEERESRGEGGREGGREEGRGRTCTAAAAREPPPPPLPTVWQRNVWGWGGARI